MRAAQEAILAEMRRWGYRYVATPTLEAVDVLAAGLGPAQVRRLFKFADGDGRLLAVVGEKTVPVARLVAGALRASPLPLRLCYAGPVLANDASRFANRRETQQAGAELIGAAGAVADAEVVALAARCLDAAGLRSYQVEVGHAEFFHGVLAGLGLAAEQEAAVREALGRRDFVSLAGLLEQTRLRRAERDLLLRFPALRGGPEIIDAARPLVSDRRSARALDELGRVAELLAAQGLGERVSLDLGAIRDFEYYTGVTFEVYGQEGGRPIAQGGRYDRLLERFGRPAPATGFVVQLDLLAANMPLPVLHVALAWTPAGLEQALRLAGTLRLFGLRVASATAPLSLAAAGRFRAEVGARDLIHCSGAQKVSWSAGRGRRRLAAEEVVGKLAGSVAR